MGFMFKTYPTSYLPCRQKVILCLSFLCLVEANSPLKLSTARKIYALQNLCDSGNLVFWKTVETISIKASVALILIKCSKMLKEDSGCRWQEFSF